MITETLRTRLLQLAAWIVLIACCSVATRAGPVDAARDFFAEKWESISVATRHGQWETYVTGYAWHVPWAYSRATRARLNETTWGGGFGRTMIDGDGDRHSVFFLTFSDSHRSPQFIASYGWQRYWRPNADLSPGWGYAAFLFSREDVAHYAPLPAVLPCLSLRYRGWELMGLYVPHVSQDIKGDVFFLYLRVAPFRPRPGSARR